MSLVSIVIPVHPAHNKTAILGACLQSITNQTYSKNNMELILIGDGCRLTHELSCQGIKTIIYNFEKHVGVSKARNKAFELSNGQLLVFIDADCVAEKTWLERLVKGFRDNNIAGCQGEIIDDKYKGSIKDVAYGVGYELPFIGFNNALLKRSILEEIGFLDEQLGIYSEDTDLGWRIYLKGYRIEYIPDAVVTHKGKPGPKNFFLYGIRTRELIRKYRILSIPSPFNIGIFMSMLRRSYKNGTFFRDILRRLYILFGYQYALIAEKLSLRPKIEPIGLTNQFLQSGSSLKPLAIMQNRCALIKPNHIIWWKSEDGCRIRNLKNKIEYALSDISFEMWECIMDGKTKDGIIDELTDEYEVEREELKKDFTDFLERLYSEEILITA